MENYYGFDSTLVPLDEGPEDEEEAYDELNDETFGDFEEDDWELNQEKLEFDFGQRNLHIPEDDRRGVHGSSYNVGHSEPQDQDYFQEEDMEKSISQLVLDDDDEFYDPAIANMMKSSSKPISIGKDPTHLGQLFGPGSPPSLFDPQLISPTAKPSIWGSPHTDQVKKKSAEDSLKAMLNIGIYGGAGDHPWHDSAVLHAVSDKAPTKILTLEEIEKGMTPRPVMKPPQDPSKIMGAPQLPIGTPPRGGQSGIPAVSPAVAQGALPQRPVTPIHPQYLQYWTQKLHQLCGGRVSPNQIGQLILKMHATTGRISPDQLRHVLMTSATQPRPVTPQGFPQAPGRTPQMTRPPPHNMAYPPPPFPFSGNTRGPLPQHQGSPAGRGGMMPPGMPRHMAGRGNTIGMPSPAKSLYGLTPMHPRIPPARPNTDPGPQRRPGPYPYGRGGQHAQRGRQDNSRTHYRRLRDDPNRDEYARLMTQKEKDWVIRIQMMAVHTDNPMVDDYYYQVMLQRRLNRAKERDAEKTPEGNSPKGDENKDEKIIRTPQTKHEHKEYKPAQFEGALGRVTYASVNNPRPLIDVHSIQTHDEEEGKLKDHGKRRKTLLSIEHMYGLLLKADDVTHQLKGLPESDTGALLEKRQQLLNQVYQEFRIQDLSNEKSNNDCILQLLSIRKGRKLISRVLSKLTDEQASSVVNIMVHHLAFILKKEASDLKKDSVEGMKRQQEETLPELFDEISHNIESKDMPELVSLVKHFLSGNVSSSSSSSPSSVVIYAMQNKFGSSLILCILSRAEALFSSTSSKSLDSSIIQDWAGCIDVIAEDLCATSDNQIVKPLHNYPLALEHFKHFVSKQSFNALDKRLRPLSIS